MGKIVLGFKLLFVLLIWSLPLLILWSPAVIVFSWTGSSVENAAELLLLCLSCLAALYAILLALATPGIMVKFSETGQISSGIAFTEVFSFTRANLSNALIAVIVVIVVQFFASLAGALLCGIGLLFTAFWALLVQSHLYAQVGLETASSTSDDQV